MKMMVLCAIMAKVPDTWRSEDKSRAENHFNNLDLVNKYSLEVSKY